jgi:hypothetical protein
MTEQVIFSLSLQNRRYKNRRFFAANATPRSSALECTSARVYVSVGPKAQEYFLAGPARSSLCVRHCQEAIR